MTVVAKGWPMAVDNAGASLVADDCYGFCPCAEFISCLTRLICA